MLHFISLLLLLVFIVLHGLLKVVLHFSDLFDLVLLALEDLFSLLKFLMFVSKTVDFSFKFVWLLLLDHPYVPCSDLLYLGQTAMGKTVAMETHFNQSCVLVEGLEHHCFN